ncbi:MAG: PadR family transcriptional regulator [Pseudomonadota bacterium]
MAKKGKSRYAVMGMLALDDMSGYDIKRHFETCLGSFWTESYGQIYPVLKSLVEEGFASSTVHRQPGRPDRVVHSLTPSGAAELASWLEEPADTELERNESLLKVLFGHCARAEQTIIHLQSFHTRRLEKIEEARQFKLFIGATAAHKPQTLFMLAAADYVIVTNEASLRWAETVIAQLQAGLHLHG